MSGRAVSGRAVSGRAVSGRTVSGRAVSGRAVSGRAVSGRAVSGRQDAVSRLLGRVSHFMRPPVTHTFFPTLTVASAKKFQRT